jgi:hypothetical protein
VQSLERQVFELPLDLLHAESVRERRVDLERRGRDPPLLVPWERGERAHVVQPVRELDQQDPDVAGHRDDHLANVLGLLVLPAPERQRIELGEAVHDARDLRPELGVELRDAHVGVLDGVVQERRLQGRGVQAEGGEDLGDRERVLDEVLARQALLPLVVLGREPVGALDLPQVRLGVVALDRAQERLDVVLGLRLTRAQAREDPAAPLGPDLLARVHVRLSPRSHQVYAAGAHEPRRRFPVEATTRAGL